MRAWQGWNASQKDQSGGQPAPRPGDEYFFYQALVGAWPFELLETGPGAGRHLPAFGERMKAYLSKALREAKQETSWLDPNLAYEKACLGFVERILDPRRSRSFLDDMAGFVRRIAPYGALNSLGQTALKLTAPGLADTYQGTELWDLSLVDPDNRRPVDFAARRQLLGEAKAIAALPPAASLAAWRDLAAAWPDGRIKLQLTLALISLRRQLPAIYTQGDYRALRVRGPAAGHVAAFGRRSGKQQLIVAIGRLFYTLQAAASDRLHRPAVWRGTTLHPAVKPGTILTDALTGRTVALERHGHLDLSRLFDPLPIAVLTVQS